tara:strand:- start:280 stop:1434 length:1155 start_codon:yes stop_codon:yes gene_type:complete
MVKDIYLTICVPAYNNTAALERAINSIKNQTISKELDVLISDDCSPNIIDKNKFIKFRRYFRNFKIVRQKNNLGVLTNKSWLFKNMQTELYSFLEHDDVIVDLNFYKRAIEAFKSSNKLVVYYGNSIVLHSAFYSNLNHSEIIKSNKSMYSLDDKSIVGINKDNSISGDDFISNFTNQKIELNTSWSAIVFKRETSLKCGGFGESYTLSDSDASLLSVFREEENGFIFFLLSLMGDFQLERNPSVIRIIEPTSYSNIQKHPARLELQDAMIFGYYKLASFIETNFNSYPIDKILKIIFKLISYTPLEYKNKKTKEFFNKYKLKNKIYQKIINASLNNSYQLRSKFKPLKLILKYLDYYFGLYKLLKLINRYLAHCKRLILNNIF